MTSISVAPEVLEIDGVRTQIDSANEWIAGILDTMPDSTTAEWYRVSNSSDKTLLGLRLNNEFGSSFGVFPSAELSSRYTFRHRLNGVLRALLRTTSRELLKRLREPVSVAGD